MPVPAGVFLDEALHSKMVVKNSSTVVSLVLWLQRSARLWHAADDAGDVKEQRSQWGCSGGQRKNRRTTHSISLPAFD